MGWLLPVKLLEQAERLSAPEVASATLLANHLPASGKGETLRSALVGFHLWHDALFLVVLIIVVVIIIDIVKFDIIKFDVVDIDIIKFDIVIISDRRCGRRWLPISRSCLLDAGLHCALLLRLDLLRFRIGREHKRERTALHQWLLLDNCNIAQLLRHLLQHRHANIRVEDLAAPELDSKFDFVAAQEKLSRLTRLNTDVVIVGLWLQADFLELDLFLILARLALLLCLLVAELSIVHHTADWRDGVRGHLDQIKPALFREQQRLSKGNNANLRSILID
jgi:hypothetical protein